MWPEHVAPNYAPLIQTWGNPIPLIWEQKTFDEWIAWKPRHFLTRLFDGEETVWQAQNGSSYKPITASAEERQSLTQETLCESTSPFGEQYTHLKSDWKEFSNGARRVTPSRLFVAIGDRKVLFENRYIFPCLLYAGGVLADDKRDNISRVCGPFGPPRPFDWLRRNDAPDCSRWPCHVTVTPAGIDVSDADASVLAPRIPTQDDIDAERARRGGFESFRDCESFIRDLCQSKEVLSRIRGDEFAYALLGVLERRVIRYRDGTELMLGGEDSAGHIVTSVRPFREHFGAFPPSSGTECPPELFSEIAALLNDCGYTIE